MIAARGKIAGSYVNICLVNLEAKKNGYDDGIILTQDGHVSEGGGQNLAIIRKKKLVVPPVSDDILEGITLDSVITLVQEEMGMEVERRRIDRTELYQSEEIFYCGTGCQIAPIVSVDRRKIGTGAPGNKTRELQTIFFDIVRGKNPKYKTWCTPVE
jgi:branched-chain amino acid aminotransferase